ncbi:MAG: nucleotidyltransferase family protein [Betaproteobacteria bacterium]|nr:nucleotidyltransferase family protein [Betaproteobacteria bacterium]
MKAMLLAAGRGERLRPLTNHTPKALVPVGGKPLIAWHLERLAASGCHEAVINVSHLAQQIIDSLGDGKRFGVRIAYSREAEPLETAGGIAQALPLLGERPFLLVNADIYCEVDFKALLAFKLGAMMAHLVLVPNPAHRPQGDFSLRERVVGREGTPRYTYSGVAVMSPQLVRTVRRGEKAPLAPLLFGAADERRITGEVFEGLWQDVGTMDRLAELESQLASRK